MDHKYKMITLQNLFKTCEVFNGYSKFIILFKIKRFSCQSFLQCHARLFAHQEESVWTDTRKNVGRYVIQRTKIIAVALQQHAKQKKKIDEHGNEHEESTCSQFELAVIRRLLAQGGRCQTLPSLIDGSSWL